MIQASKKLLLLFLFIYFCLFSSGVVYGAGVTIDFSSFTLGSISIISNSWPTNNNPSSQPIQSTTPTPSTPTSTNTSYTSTNLTPNNNTIINQNSITSLNIPELMKELSQPATFSALSENEPLWPDAEPYVVKVCLSFNNIYSSNCSDKATSAQASEKLAEIFLNKYFKGSESRPFRIVLPSLMPKDQQKQFLYQIELQAIDIIESRIFKADRIFIKEYDKIAREEAISGVNWSHIFKDDKSIHDFYTKKAFTKLNNIAIQEKKLNSKNFKNN